MKFVVISTYPEQGTKNIGDQLITNCLIKLIKDNCSSAEFDLVWRADNWENVKDKIYDADHVLFACLALRPKMHIIEYPYLNKIVESGIPFSVIAAGTDLSVTDNCDIYSTFSSQTLELLRKINKKASIFTTRGLVSQEACRRYGLSRAKFTGDIAFYDRSLNGLCFAKEKEIERIVVSDPHFAKAYLRPMSVLVDGLKSLFPKAEIVVAQHGVSKVVEKFCVDKALKNVKIYEHKNRGLDIYDNADLHVGFRVHGHVSALKRRKYSYLLEQDGRGCDYGITIERKLSIPNYNSGAPSIGIKNLVKFMMAKPLSKRQRVSVSPAYQMLALINGDIEAGFQRFVGLENQIFLINCALEEAILPIFNQR